MPGDKGTHHFFWDRDWVYFLILLGVKMCDVEPWTIGPGRGIFHMWLKNNPVGVSHAEGVSSSTMALNTEWDPI